MADIQINRYECLEAQMTWTDDDGQPLDLTGKTISIIDASPRSLKQGTVTVTDALAGISELFIGRDLSATMGLGRSNWIRLCIGEDGNSCIDTTPQIWIEVV